MKAFLLRNLCPSKKPIPKSGKLAEPSQKPIAQSENTAEPSRKPVVESGNTAEASKKTVAESGNTVEASQKPIAENGYTAEASQTAVAECTNTAEASQKPVAESGNTVEAIQKPIAENGYTAEASQKPVAESGNTAEASPKPIAESRNTAEAIILSVIQKLEKYREDKTREGMERVIKEMTEILDIVRDKKLGEGRRLNFLVSDLVNMADDALRFCQIYLHPHYSGDTESIHDWIGEIKKRMLKVGVDGAETTELSNDDGQGDDQYVVGLERDVDLLIRTWFIPWMRYFSPFLIRGMSGIGKTTLARQLYNHAGVVDHFECRAWVCVANLSLKELFIKLIQQVAEVVDDENLHTSSLLEEMDNQSLLDMLRQHLQGRRFLIVLDDVPGQMPLHSFLYSLDDKKEEGEEEEEEYDDEQDANNQSKLILTSHMTHGIIRYPRNVRRMEFLDSNNSWQLFLETVNRGNKLTTEQKFPKHLERKAKHMLISKCGGLPLAIKEVGKQLAEKKVSGESEWEQLLESVDFDSTMKVLESYYHKLDPKLETHFLYMAFYKENTTLRAEKLTQIWEAAALVAKYNFESDLHSLTNESVIDVKDKSTEYHMNPLLHMLFIQKAKEKLGFEILSKSNGPSQIDARHRVIKCSREKFNYSTNQDKHLVSLFFHGGGYFDASPSYWKSFELLKILDLDDFGIKILPESIGTLMELRYLGLRNNYIKELPKSLGCLENLEVLDIAQNFMVEVPDVIWEIGSLLHLYMSDVICRKPFWIDALQRLKTLTYVSINNWIYELSGLKMLTSLEKLGIEELDGNSDVSKLFVSLADLEYLEHLTLRGYRFRSMPCLDELGILNSLITLKLDGRLSMLPTSFPPEISSLTMVNSCLDKDPMPVLEKLSSLKYLKLRNAYTGQQMVISRKGLGVLNVLCIEELWNLRNVQLGEGAMYWLEKLEIHDCPYLDTLPEAIVSKFHLEELKIVTTKKIATKITTKIRNSETLSRIGIVSIN